MITKKTISFIVIIIISFFASFSAAAQNNLRLYINSEEIISDTPAMIVNDRTMLPMRTISEKLGAVVTWIPESRIIFVAKDTQLIVMQVGNPQMSIQSIGSDDPETVTLDAEPFIYNDRTFVPVRTIAEALQATVDWNAETKSISITI